MIYITTLGVKQGRSSNNYVLNTNTSSQKRILVVDDQQERAKLFAIALKDNGFVVNVFNDPLSALSNFKAGLYDLLLLDSKCPV